MQLNLQHAETYHGNGKNLVQFALSKNKGKFRVRCNELRVESHQFYEAIGFVKSKNQYVFQINTQNT